MPADDETQKLLTALETVDREEFVARIKEMHQYAAALSTALTAIEKCVDQGAWVKAVEKFMCAIGFLLSHLNQVVPHACKSAGGLWYGAAFPASKE